MCKATAAGRPRDRITSRANVSRVSRFDDRVEILLPVWMLVLKEINYIRLLQRDKTPHWSETSQILGLQWTENIKNQLMDKYIVHKKNEAFADCCTIVTTGRRAENREWFTLYLKTWND